MEPKDFGPQLMARLVANAAADKAERDAKRRAAGLVPVTAERVVRVKDPYKHGILVEKTVTIETWVKPEQ